MARDNEMVDAASGLVTVTIDGSGPYGFRLSGGDGAPLAVIKMRRQGKGHQAGLKEGDIVLGINGFNGRSMSHSAAMGLLESAVQSVELLVYRGPADQVNTASVEAESRLRPLPLGAAPPPRVLPPPPATETGQMVIDQPAYTRTAAEKFVVQFDTGHHQNRLTNGSCVDLSQMTWKPPGVGQRGAALNGSRPLSALPVTGHDEFQLASPTVPFRVPSPLDLPRTPATDYSTATWPGSNRREPLNQETVNFHVSHTTAKPWIWQPSVTYEIHTDVQSEPLEWLPVPDLTIAPEQASGRRGGAGEGHHRDQPDGRRAERNGAGGGRSDESSIPKWALPLRSDYDWRKSYPWADNENVNPLDDDEWEYVYTNDGQLIKRKKKIFADSSFYDDPNHQYPTIEEQIKMARRVAQSLTSAGNVTARGQRMFLRRKEKADRWVVSEVPPHNMAALLRMGSGHGVVRPVRHEHQQEDDGETDAELYYNPTPWARPRAKQQRQQQYTAPAPAVKTPTMGARLPWKTDFDPTSEAASALRPPSPPPLPSPGASFNQVPKQWNSAKETGSGRAPPKGASGAGASVAFSLAKELRGMKGRGGKMFAKKRAQAAEAEKRDELADTLRGRTSTTFGGGHDEDWTDSAAFGSVEAELGGVSPPWNREGGGQSVRLLELIERNRASSPGQRWTQPTTSFAASAGGHSMKDSSSFGNFSIDYTTKSRGSFRPVRFKTSGGATSVHAPSVFDDYSAADGVPISDF